MILSFFRSSPVAICAAFLFIFGASVQGLPFNTAKLVLLLAMCVFALMLVTSWSRGDFRLAPAPLYIILFISISLVLYSSAVVLVHQTADFTLTYNLFILTFENIIGSYVFYRVFLNDKSFHRLLDVFVWVGIIQSLIIIFMFANLTFREFVFEWFANEATIEMSERYGGIRGFGIAGSVTYDLSVFLSIIMIFCTYQMINTSRSQFFYIFAWILCLFSVIVSGRTGLLGVFLSILILIRFSMRFQAITGITKLVMIVLVSALSFPFIFYLYFPEIWFLIQRVLFPWAFEMFFSVAKGEGFQTESTEILQGMYFPLPENTFFFGDARWLGDGGEGYYMHTDAGYMRHALFYGLFGSLLLYLMYFGLFSYLYKLSGPVWKFVVFALFGYAFIVHLKGDFLAGSGMNIKIFFLLFVFFLLAKRNSVSGRPLVF